MNRKVVLRMTGVIALLEAAMLLVPAAVSLFYGEKNGLAFVYTALIAAAVGFPIVKFCRPEDKVIYSKEGFVIVAIAWLFMSAVGALPFVISGQIPSYINAFFETVSGFTTTGASILTDVTALDKCMLFWRSFTHWIGGMGVLVFIMAIIPTGSERSIHIMRAEMTGPVIGKLVPKVRNTAKILYLIYVALTALEVLLLVCGKMSLFDSLVHSFGTAGTGGLGIKPDSIGSYSPYCQWVIAIFMTLFGINFNLYYLILIRRVRSALKSSELWCYFIIIALATAVIGFNIYSTVGSISGTVRTSFFQVSSIMTTTGYSTVDFNTWPGLSKSILFVLMFVGGCAGSTAGGLKLSRVMILFKIGLRELKKMLRPRSVCSVRHEGKTLESSTLKSVENYFVIYVFCIALIFLAISFEPFGFESNFTAVVACINNIGPGFDAVGPSASFAAYTGFSKIVLSVAMLIGRLEIFPILLVLSPAVWMRHK